jgi:hypothetical protein
MAKLPEASEHAIQIELQEYLTLKGIYCWRNNSGALIDRRGIPVRFGKVGSADILGIAKDGKLLAVEVKRPSMSYKPTPAQIDFLTAIKKNGGYAGIATSIADVERILNGEYPGL